MLHLQASTSNLNKNPIEGNGELVLEDPQEYVDLMSNPKISDQYPEENSYYYDDEINSKYLDLTKKLGMKIVEKDTNAVRFVSRYTRNAHPDDVVWDLSTRAEERKTNSFYWLQVDSAVNNGIIF